MHGNDLNCAYESSKVFLNLEDKISLPWLRNVTVYK